MQFSFVCNLNKEQDILDGGSFIYSSLLSEAQSSVDWAKLKAPNWQLPVPETNQTKMRRRVPPIRDSAVTYILDNKDNIMPQCRICNMFCTSEEELRTHQKESHKEYSFFCKLCGKGFKTWSGHSGHMERHRRGEM